MAKITATDCRRLELEAVPRDTNRSKKGNLRDKADVYLLASRHLVIKVMHDMIHEAAWDVLDPLDESGKPETRMRSRVTSHFVEVGSVWLTSVCPQAGGILTKVKLVDHDGVALSKKNQLAMLNTPDRNYFVPQQQVDLFRKVYDDLLFYFGPTLRGQDFFGDDFERHCPVILRKEGVGVVGVIMPLRRVA